MYELEQWFKVLIQTQLYRETAEGQHSNTMLPCSDEFWERHMSSPTRRYKHITGVRQVFRSPYAVTERTDDDFVLTAYCLL